MYLSFLLAVAAVAGWGLGLLVRIILSCRNRRDHSEDLGVDRMIFLKGSQGYSVV
jgi:hypothetical protein